DVYKRQGTTSVLDFCSILYWFVPFTWRVIISMAINKNRHSDVTILINFRHFRFRCIDTPIACLLYTSDAADEVGCVDL
ncbi:hypothetical protein KQJ29_34730, partial [Enterococcus sp. S181_ASV_20]|nr:hypothetical protein [Enterococcus sp. S181_ASV_20]